MTLSARDLRDLEYAHELLENPSFAARLVNLVGQPFEKGLEALPPGVSEKITAATRQALEAALDVSLDSLDPEPTRGPANFFHRAVTGISGAVGGSMGVGGLLIELPVTTCVMLRSIADIARYQGEDLASIEARLACLTVFALGGRSPNDDGAETGYFAVRAVLAQQVAEAARVLATRGFSEREAPALVRLIASIAARFGIVVSEKTAAQLVPLIGGVTGAAVNLAFTDHFQRVATGHFIVRRLEREHGEDLVESEYSRFSS